jgi:hypothetical protein
VVPGPRLKVPGSRSRVPGSRARSADRGARSVDFEPLSRDHEPESLDLRQSPGTATQDPGTFLSSPGISAEVPGLARTFPPLGAYSACLRARIRPPCSSAPGPAARADLPAPRATALIQAKRRRKLPVVLTPEEVKGILAQIQGTDRLFVALLYGTGMRIVDLAEHLKAVRRLQEHDLAMGLGRVHLPYALARNAPNKTDGRPAQRAGRVQPRDEAEGRFPG